MRLETARAALKSERSLRRPRKRVLAALQARVDELRRRRPAKRRVKPSKKGPAKKRPAKRRVKPAKKRVKKSVKKPVKKRVKSAKTRVKKPAKRPAKKPAKRRVKAPRVELPPAPSEVERLQRSLAEERRRFQDLLAEERRKTQLALRRIRLDLREELENARREIKRLEFERQEAERRGDFLGIAAGAGTRSEQQDLLRQQRAQFEERFQELLEEARVTGQLGEPPTGLGPSVVDTRFRQGSRVGVSIEMRLVPETVQTIVDMVIEASLFLSSQDFPRWLIDVTFAGIGEKLAGRYGAMMLRSDEPIASRFQTRGTESTGVYGSYDAVIEALRRMLAQKAADDAVIFYVRYVVVVGYQAKDPVSAPVADIRELS